MPFYAARFRLELRQQRRGIEAEIVGIRTDEPDRVGRPRQIAVAAIFDRLQKCRADAQQLGCTAEVEHARTILARGTSAQWQVDTYKAALAEGASEEEALRAVVDMLIRETAQGI